jgi:hypothetical protein
MKKKFDGNLKFDEHLYPLVCRTEWIDEIILKIYECLNSDRLPKSGGGWNGQGCEQCSYKKQLAKIMEDHIRKNTKEQ